MAEREPFAVQAAKFSLWAPVVAIIVGLMLPALKGFSQVRFIYGLVITALIAAAFLLGIVALTGMRKHGPKGILVRGILGTTFSGLVLSIAIWGIYLTATQRKAAATQTASTASVKPFTFTPPARFVAYADGKKDYPHAIQSYIEGDPESGEPAIILLIEDMGGILGKGDLARYLAESKKDNVQVLHENWQGQEITVVEVSEITDGIPMLAYNAPLPVLPKAIQVRVLGAAARRNDLQTSLREALAAVEGSTNW